MIKKIFYGVLIFIGILFLIGLFIPDNPETSSDKSPLRLIDSISQTKEPIQDNPQEEIEEEIEEEDEEEIEEEDEEEIEEEPEEEEIEEPEVIETKNIKIANWNLQIFGDTKASKPDLMNTYVSIIDD